MQPVNPNIKFRVVFGIFIVLIVFTVITFSSIINVVDNETYQKNKKIYSSIGYVSLALISLLFLISFWGISQDPSIFGPYVLGTTHFSLLLSILAVTFSTFNVKSV